jgi:hypothetical protein
MSAGMEPSARRICTHPLMHSQKVEQNKKWPVFKAAKHNSQKRVR